MRKFLTIFGFILLILLLTFSVIWSNVRKWNDGVCKKCGTEWHLLDIEHDDNSEYYYYECENHHTIRLWEDIK